MLINNGVKLVKYFCSQGLFIYISWLKKQCVSHANKASPYNRINNTKIIKKF